jgi:hypothetical protein
MARSAGYMTELTTEAGRPIYIDQNGEPVSEKSMTIEVDGKWVNVPSIHDGIIYNEDELADMVRNKEIKPTSTHKSQELAVKKARSRSGGLMSPETEQKLREQYADFMGQRESLAAERMEDVPEGFSDQGIMAAEDKVLDKQMTTAFAEGGLLDEGGSVDPVSGNDVPVGSTKEEVRDDIPAQLSEGEFVLPADVVRYIGLENLMKLRAKAKQGLAQMEAMGQMGNAEEATMEDDGEYDADIDELIESFDPNDPETLKFAEGGMPTYQYQPQQNIYSPTANYNPYTGMTGQPQQFTAGYMPQTTYQAPPVYGANSGRFTSGQPMGGGTAEQRQYVGPNGELRTFTFIDGKPTEEIPAGFKVYKPEKQTAPQVVQPKVGSVDMGGGGGDGPQDTPSTPNLGMTQEEIDEALGAVNKDLAKALEGKPKTFAQVVSKGIIGNLVGAIQRGYYTQKAVNQVKEGFGLTKPMTPEYQSFRNEMSTPMAASVARTEQEARDVTSGDSGLDGSSFGSQAEAEAVGSSGWGSQAHFDAIDAQFDSLESTSNVGTTTDTSSGYEGWG